MTPRSLIASPFVAGVFLYRVTLSPFVGRQCRYEPTCSAFALDALRLYPLPKALVLTAKRLGRCHPAARGGYDPVPIPDATEQPDPPPERSPSDGTTASR